jgi:hypothetical protein
MASWPFRTTHGGICSACLSGRRLPNTVPCARRCYRCGATTRCWATTPAASVASGSMEPGFSSLTAAQRVSVSQSCSPFSKRYTRSSANCFGGIPRGDKAKTEPEARCRLPSGLETPNQHFGLSLATFTTSVMHLVFAPVLAVRFGASNKRAGHLVMPKLEWRIDSATPRTLRLEHDCWSGRSLLRLDGVVIHRRGIAIGGFTHQFEIDGKESSVEVRSQLLFGYRYAVWIGRKEVPLLTYATEPGQKRWVLLSLAMSGLTFMSFALLLILGTIEWIPLALGKAIVIAGLASSTVAGPVGVAALDQRSSTRKALLVGGLAAIASLPAVVYLKVLLFGHD